MDILITICSISLLHYMLFLYISKQMKNNKNKFLNIKSGTPVY
jgi:hypothetical protein